ncbi:MAG TPA: bifunctional glutamate N-acetyltransferase/amino-acid acetyltransferase ArgJ [Vicinamibacterales bacterium]
MATPVASTVSVIPGGITAPAGFRAAGVHCGIKARGLDLALVEADRVVAAAGVFTTNLAVAAPVLVSREHLRTTGGRARAIVVNSGCANACTGEAGVKVAELMTAETARALGCDAEEVLVASTGVIGVSLDPRTVTAGIIAAADALSRDAHAEASQAIMTTDPFPKEHAVRVDTGAGTYHIGGMCKGSGMIEPRLATMLGFLTTDAAVEPALLQRALADACETTFNAITVDGECSTNDTVFALASGASGVTIDEKRYEEFVDALRAVCRELALGIVRGGEGATKLVSVHVTGARTYDQAKQAARAIANSLLVKTAIHGGDPNWGRLVAVAGRCGAEFSLSSARVRIGDTVLFEQGRPFDERAPEAAAHLQGRDIRIEVDLGTGGPEDATMWTCDLSADYVRINADYRT